MKQTGMLFASFAALLLLSLTVSAQTTREQLNGTWSGGWNPTGGIRDAMTIELRYEEGRLAGRFVTPVEVKYSKASFDARTRQLLLEAADEATGRLYKLDAKVEGTEIKGTLTAGNQSGPVELIKWTFVPPVR
jgi:hypothetical protein